MGVRAKTKPYRSRVENGGDSKGVYYFLSGLDPAEEFFFGREYRGGDPSPIATLDMSKCELSGFRDRANYPGKNSRLFRRGGKISDKRAPKAYP